jgi:DNA mismatch repair ATPase MutL
MVLSFAQLFNKKMASTLMSISPSSTLPSSLHRHASLSLPPLSLSDVYTCSGVWCRPDSGINSREAQAIFVNGRPVHSPMLSKIVDQVFIIPCHAYHCSITNQINACINRW